MILIALLIQTATVAPDVPQRFSILAPPQCARQAPDSDIVVCGANGGEQRLPLPDERGPPDRPMPSNPNRTGIGALDVAATPCAALQGGCQVGFGPPIMPIINGAVGLVKSALAKKPDKTGRVDIPLEDPPLRPLEP